MQSRLTIVSEPLQQNKNWSIEKISSTEIAITDSWTVSYCYYDADKKRLMFDCIIAPKYVINKALKLAVIHLETIYNTKRV